MDVFDDDDDDRPREPCDDNTGRASSATESDGKCADVDADDDDGEDEEDVFDDGAAAASNDGVSAGRPRTDTPAWNREHELRRSGNGRDAMLDRRACRTEEESECMPSIRCQLFLAVVKTYKSPGFDKEVEGTTVSSHAEEVCRWENVTMSHARQ